MLKCVHCHKDSVIQLAKSEDYQQRELAINVMMSEGFNRPMVKLPTQEPDEEWCKIFEVHDAPNNINPKKISFVTFCDNGTLNPNKIVAIYNNFVIAIFTGLFCDIQARAWLDFKICKYNPQWRINVT